VKRLNDIYDHQNQNCHGMYTPITPFTSVGCSTGEPSPTLHKHISVNYHLKDLGQVQIPVPPSYLHVSYQGSMNQQDKQQPCKGKLFHSFYEPKIMTNDIRHTRSKTSLTLSIVHSPLYTHTDKLYFKTVKSVRTLEIKTKMFILTISFPHDHWK
jgi:hypothetical protein